jgi:enoyl-CoA hydratase
MPMEGIGQLYLRLLTDNFEEAVRAREEGRPAIFRDDR